MKQGDKVKIKKYSEIKQLLRNLYFDGEMRTYCGKTLTLDIKKIKSFGTIWSVIETGWWFDERWLIPPFFSDEDFEI